MAKESKNAPSPATSLGQKLSQGEVRYVDFRPVGATGLNVTSAGYLFDEKIRALQGQRGMEMYKEMDADSTIGNALNIIERTARQAAYRVVPASQEAKDVDAAQFVETCLEDMDLTFSDILSDAVRGVTQFGFYLGAMQYKRRTGKSDVAYLNSRYADGRIGWRSITGLAQETITRWFVDEDTGAFTAIEQNAPPHFQFERVPYDRLIHIRQSTHKNSPIGISMLRCVFKDYFLKTRIENLLAIGAERSVVGLGVMSVPPAIASPLTAEDQQSLEAYKNIVTRFGTHENQGMVMPLEYDERGNPLYKFELLSTESSHLEHLLEVVKNLDVRIAEALQTEFSKLGEVSAGGSYAMHQDKTDMHSQMIDNLLSCVADQFNRFAIPKLFEMNDFDVNELPKLSFDSAKTQDLAALAAYVQALASAGMPLFPNEQLQEYLLSAADLPTTPQNLDGQPDLPPLSDVGVKEEQEIRPGEQAPEGAPQSLRDPSADPYGTTGV